MDDGDLPVLIYATFPSLEEATRIGEALVAARLAACINAIPGMISIYEWEGARERAEEVAMIIKTRAGLSEQVVAEVEKLHPYDVPALLVLEVSGGSQAYCDWIARETGGGRP